MKRGALLTARTPSSFGGTLISPPPPDHVAEWLDNRVGFGKKTDAGSTMDYDVVTVTKDTTAGGAAGAANDSVGTEGTLRWALSLPGKTIVRFAPGLGDITAGGKVEDPTTPKPGWKCTPNTLFDGYGYAGLLRGFVDSSNCDNFCGMYLSAAQPFNYGGNPSGGVFTAANCPNAYFWHVTGWDTGDIIVGSGAYALTPGHLGDLSSPFFCTVDRSRFGPNPAPYGFMSPIRGTFVGTYFPGAYNAIDNDARNGKCINSAYDHNWVDGSTKSVNATFTDSTHFTLSASQTANYGNGFVNIQSTLGPGHSMPAGSDGEGVGYTLIDATHGVLSSGSYTGTLGVAVAVFVYKTGSPAHKDQFPLFDQSAYVTFINSVYQGCVIRNGKARSQYADIINNVIAKYGTPYDLWQTATTTGGSDGLGDSSKLATHYGAGPSCDDDGVVNIEGNVLIPYANGEQVVGFQDSVADPLIAANPSYNMHRIRVGFLPNGSADPGGGAVNNSGIHMEGTAHTNGSAKIDKNWVAGQSVDSAHDAVGFTREDPNPAKIPSTDGYSLTVIDASVYANALAIVHNLEDTAGTRAGNPWSATQPPSWRDVDTIGTFPA